MLGSLGSLLKEVQFVLFSLNIYINFKFEPDAVFVSVPSNLSCASAKQLDSLHLTESFLTRVDERWLLAKLVLFQCRSCLIERLTNSIVFSHMMEFCLSAKVDYWWF